ncbi:DNA-binding protein [Noviherbaspirillum galbum]|uniref:DNA-binding protein n=1 Tax=Noviherbaspirillum galbum TaxID=2709383 RepID=UPI002E280550|nr:DNA-binding protein [Noviherbaspirillum galbum]
MKPGSFTSPYEKARDALIAKGLHPSVDAVRIALGNTGSKTTIHKYLRELEEEEGDRPANRGSLSEELQDLVMRLAARLHEEAMVEVANMRTEQQAQEKRHAEAVAGFQHEVSTMRAAIERLETDLALERSAHATTREELHQQTVARHTAQQHAADLMERLAENEAHRQSLEEKHRHAREALEHYRQSVVTQREQEASRHEQQVQQLQAELRMANQTISVKQEEVTRLNQDGVRLVSDLSHAQKVLYDTQTQLRQLEQKVEALTGADQRATMLDEQLRGRDKQIQLLTESLAQKSAAVDAAVSQSRALELEMVSLQARITTHQAISDELRRYVTSAAGVGASKDDRP